MVHFLSLLFTATAFSAVPLSAWVLSPTRTYGFVLRSSIYNGANFPSIGAADFADALRLLSTDPLEEDEGDVKSSMERVYRALDDEQVRSELNAEQQVSCVRHQRKPSRRASQTFQLEKSKT